MTAHSTRTSTPEPVRRARALPRFADSEINLGLADRDFEEKELANWGSTYKTTTP